LMPILTTTQPGAIGTLPRRNGRHEAAQTIWREQLASGQEVIVAEIIQQQPYIPDDSYDSAQDDDDEEPEF